MGYIYKITHIPTGNYYIGKRCSLKDFNSYYGSGPCWKKFMEDKPIEEFKKEILAFEKDKEKLSNLETTFIGDKWKTDHFSNGGHCYNCSRGGDGGGAYMITEETRHKLSVAATKQWRRMTKEERDHMSRRGKKLSKESKDKIRKAMLGRQSPNKGKPAWNKGKKMSPEFSKKVSQRMKKWHKNKNMVSIA